MRFIPEKDIAGHPFQQHEKFFLDCWYGLTHMNSLDSYRAKCLNARTIVREVNEELKIGLIDDPEFRSLCAEAMRTLQSDHIVQSAFTNSFAILGPLLEKPPSLPGSSKRSKEKEDADNLTQLQDLRFAIGDLSAALEARYLNALCDAILSTIVAGQTVGLAEVINSLISDLVDRGWPLKSLLFWYQHFIFQKEHTFHENLAFMLRQFVLPPQDFEVTLRVNAATKLKKLDEFGPFKLSKTNEIKATTAAEKRFASSDNYVVFAKGKVKGVDGASAAIAAREQFESLLDVASFEFLRTTLKIDERIYVVRCDDGRAGLPEIANPVPNPVESFDESDFKAFSNKLTTVLELPTLAPESKIRIQAAFRQYRFGRDSQNYADKFLNWWMGLETLAKVDGEKIGRAVTRNISHVMLTGYFHRILLDLLVTFKYLNMPWTGELEATYGAKSLAELDIEQLVKLLQEEKHTSYLLDALKERPVIAAQTEKITAWLRDPARAATQLEGHLQRIQWQIDRLYRIRCCIVHGSSVRFRLALFVANLEYYLKQSLIFALNAFHNHRHITDLVGLFQRCAVMWDRRLKALKAKPAKVPLVSEAVFADVVVAN